MDKQQALVAGPLDLHGVHGLPCFWPPSFSSWAVEQAVATELPNRLLEVVPLAGRLMEVDVLGVLSLTMIAQDGSRKNMLKLIKSNDRSEQQLKTKTRHCRMGFWIISKGLGEKCDGQLMKEGMYNM